MYNNKKKLLGLVSLWLPIAAATAGQMDYGFSSPTFNGNGYGTYVLTIKQLQDTAKANNDAKAQAVQDAATAAAQNTPQAQFVSNLQSRIYSQLALNITNTLFGATGQPSCGNNCGGSMDVGGNTITWSLNNASNTIQIKIVNQANPNQYTNMTVPVGTFAF
jgi:hypothetical protein